MIAVIEVGGNQYIVKPGDIITVDRMDDGETTKVFAPLLVVDDEGKSFIGTPEVKGASVTCTVVDHPRGDKVRVFKMKSKKHYHRTQGFRASETRLEIGAIAV